MMPPALAKLWGVAPEKIFALVRRRSREEATHA
jgi:hypothetical protein